MGQLDRCFAGIPANARGGNTNNFLAALFADTFNRPLDQSGGQTFGAADVAPNRDRVRLAEQMFATDEFRQDLVQSYYQRLLNRSGDPGGVNAASAALKNGVIDETLTTVLVGSPEYLKLAGQVLIGL